MKLFLIDLLKEQDVPGFRTHNAWSKATWTTIVRHVNTKFGTSYSLNQVKQQEQDLKKAYRSVKDLLAESGFGWDNERMMVIAPASVWASFTARKNNKDALHWQDRSSHIMMLYLHSTMVRFTYYVLFYLHFSLCF